MSVLLAGAQAALGTGVVFTTGASSDSVVVGDVNADTYADLIVTSIADNATSVLIGDGKGSFGLTGKSGAGSDFSRLSTFHSGLTLVHSKQRLVSLVSLDLTGKAVSLACEKFSENLYPIERYIGMTIPEKKATAALFATDRSIEFESRDRGGRNDRNDRGQGGRGGQGNRGGQGGRGNGGRSGSGRSQGSAGGGSRRPVHNAPFAPTPTPAVV